MADDVWTRRSAVTTYRFVRVSRSTGLEVGDIPVLRGGSIERNADTRVYERASVNVVGRLDLGRDLVRIRMAQEWPGGESRDVALGTFVPSMPSRDVHGRYSTSRLSLTGRLQELYDDGFASPVTIAAGTNVVSAARDVCEQMGLEVVSDASSCVTSRVRTYGIGERSDSSVGDTKLDMVNDLLGIAGFWGARTDPMGRIVFRRYAQLADRPVSWAFEEGPSAKFLRDMTDERDTSGVANHVVCVYSGEGSRVVGEAWDTDPSSEYSTVSVGRAITKGYSYSELPDGGQPEADAQAATLLRQGQAVIRRVTMSHVYVPVAVDDAVTLRYATGAVTGKFEVRTQTLSLVAGCHVEAELKSWER